MAKNRRGAKRTANNFAASFLGIRPSRRPASPLDNMIAALYAVVALAFGFGLIYGTSSMVTSALDVRGNPATHLSLGSKFRAVKEELAEFKQAETQAQYEVTPPAAYDKSVTDIQIAIDTGRSKLAMARIRFLHDQLAADHAKLAAYINEQALRANADPGQQFQVPILIYHYTPPDFESQLSALEAKGYTTISLDALDAAMHHTGGLPQKPVIITFDDGFANQMAAFDLLGKHHMQATYYIIDGGERSRWCIGAGRRFGDPLQPPGGCGDAYLNWDQVRQLDRSGIITIASHTVDHENLASQSPEEQRFEIFEGKRLLEKQLGHRVRHFAYPYGGFNGTTQELVRQAGFVTAVSTLPGMQHNLGTELSLHRVRSVTELP